MKLGFLGPENLALHSSFTLLAKQSSQPTHVQRAQLAVGTSFRFWGSSVGPRHHLLCQMRDRADALCRSCCGISGGQNIAAAQIEVRAFSEQTLSWLGLWKTFVGPPWTRLPLWWRNWNPARRVWAEPSWGPPHQRSSVLPRRQRYWRTGSALPRAATNEDLALRLWDQGRPGLLAAYGLNDQLVSKLALKAEGSCARKTE